MTLNRFIRPEYQWNPVRHLSLLRDEIDRLFDAPTGEFGRLSQPFMGGGWPTVDILEDKDHVVVRSEIPGMRKQDIEISLHQGVLSISGERKPEEGAETMESHRSERFVGRFHRAVTLPVAVEADACQATYQDGILTVALPKAEQAKPKQIMVKTGKA